MDFQDLIQVRRSVRHYLPSPIDRGLLEILAEAVQWAPSASNQQPWRLIFVDDPELRNKVAEATFSGPASFNSFSTGAPVLAVLCREKPRILNRIATVMKGLDWTLIDIGIAASQLCLQGAELGLGTCMLGWFNEVRIKKLLGIPRGTRVRLVITLGWPADTDGQGNAPPGTRVKRRKSLDEVRAYNHY